MPTYNSGTSTAISTTTYADIITPPTSAHRSAPASPAGPARPIPPDHAPARSSRGQAPHTRAPGRHMHTRWIAQHLLDADRIHMHIQRGPTLARPAPDAIDIRPVRQQLFDLHLAAKLAEPGGQGLGHARLARRSGARPGLLGGDTGDADEAAEPGGELFGRSDHSFPARRVMKSCPPLCSSAALRGT